MTETTTALTSTAADFAMDSAPDNGAGLTAHEDATTAAMAAGAAREIETALILAAKRPRDEQAAVVRIERACARPSLAGSAIYSFPRGGSRVTGPSVVLARELARSWGNVRWGIDILPSDESLIHLRAWAWDLEANTKVTSEDRFRKLIPKSTGRRDADGRKITNWVEPDERDLRELVNRRGAFGVRNCLLQILPADVIELAMGRCAQTSAKAARNELEMSREDTIRNIVRAFDDMGVSLTRIEERLGHKVADVTPEEIVDLRTDYKSIRDGNSRVEEHFPIKGTDSAEASSQTAATSAAAARAKAAIDASAPAEEPAQDALFEEPKDAQGYSEQDLEGF